MKGAQHPLADFYPSVSNVVNRDEDPYPHFRSFCLDHRQEMISLITTRLVQTNVINRCANLVPAFTCVARRSHGKPMSLVEIGASAGLNLLWDRYGYSYGGDVLCGDPSSPVQLSSILRGAPSIPVANPLPAVESRLGLDLAPIDIGDAGAALWLRALVWPERRDEQMLLEQAIELAQNDPPTVLGGDALELLPEVLSTVPGDSALCLFHTHTLNQFSLEARERWWTLIQEFGSRRDLYVISQEGVAGGEYAALELTSVENGVTERQHLANCDSHGHWIEWLVPEPSAC